MRKLKKLFATKSERLVECYDRLPRPIHHITEPLIKWTKVFFLFVAEIRVRAFWLCGESENGGKHSVLYIGKAEGLKPVSQLIGYQNSLEVERQILYCWQIRKFLRAPHIGIDCVVFRANTLLCRFVRPCNYMRLPPSIKSYVDFSGSCTGRESAIHQSIKRRQKKLIAKRYTTKIIPGEQGLNRFYYDLYVPYAERRFGQDAKIESFQKVRRLLRTGFLIVAEKEGQWFSGAVARIRNGVFVFELVGNLSGDVRYTYEGTMEFLYLSFFQIARERNCIGIDFGISPPFLKNGLVFYKTKWGATLLENPKEVREICIKINRPERLRFLKNFPVIKDCGGLSAITYIGQDSTETKASVANIEKVYKNAGLKALWLCTPNRLIQKKV